jgi:hypothetical protein
MQNRSERHKKIKKIIYGIKKMQWKKKTEFSKDEKNYMIWKTD